MRDQREHRKKQEGPDGRWPKRSPFSQQKARTAAKVAGRKRAAKLLGRLPTALKVTIDPKRLLVESRVPWSMVHQEGAGRTGRAPSIPARPYLWISRGLVREIVTIIEKAIDDGWSGKRATKR
jgi:phage gpG-like protein